VLCGKDWTQDFPICILGGTLPEKRRKRLNQEEKPPWSRGIKELWGGAIRNVEIQVPNRVQNWRGLGGENAVRIE